MRLSLIKKNQKGFTAPEIIFIGVIIVVIGFMGWLVWHHKNRFFSNQPKKTHNQILPLQSYSYNNNGVSFSFKYPQEFKDASNTSIATTISLKQCETNSDSLIVGCVYASYAPYMQDDQSNTPYIITTLLRDKNKSVLPQFIKYVSNQGDCTLNSFLTTDTNKLVLECNTPQYLKTLGASASDTITGKTIFAAGKNGWYAFSFWSRASFWDAHTSDWQSMFKSIDYN